MLVGGMNLMRHGLLNWSQPAFLQLFFELLNKFHTNDFSGIQM